jgi:ubiquinone/menaquinone biosynthesis C-methylase UbiE
MADAPIAHPWFAALYDRMTASMERGFMGATRRSLVGSVTGRVLEIGCGTGANFAHYAAAEVVATEPDPHMLARATRRAAETGRPIDLRQAPAEALPFPDGSFDTVVSTLVLCTVGDPPRALAEVRRVLRPGGTFHFCEHVRSDRAWAALVQDAITPLWRRLAGGCHPNRDVIGLIRAAGLDLVRVAPVRDAPLPVFFEGMAVG